MSKSQKQTTVPTTLSSGISATGLMTFAIGIWSGSSISLEQVLREMSYFAQTIGLQGILFRARRIGDQDVFPETLLQTRHFSYLRQRGSSR